VVLHAKIVVQLVKDVVVVGFVLCAIHMKQKYKQGEIKMATKANTGDKVWVMVETVSMFRERYMVEAPASNPEYALDDVTCETAKEFSQLHVGETIMSHRVMTEDEAITLCDIDNDYTQEWTKEQKIKTFFTREGETRDF
jgi:hypothetical protein